ncbi:MAG: nucleotide exchange factor GrpE [Candidatus Thermoplasmatota archaeon]|jgi:molecular chaperone GrpE|nr:nucleotide exchange factor GrpE [Candidatus Thermoplasmatota archaeon]
MGDKGQETLVREPVTQIVEVPDGANVVVELPGVSQDAIRMALSGDVVKIEALGLRGKFSTIQVMPFDPDPESVAISFSQGVLEISLKKKPSPPPAGPEASPPPEKCGEFTFSLEPQSKEAEQVRKELKNVLEERSALESRLKLLLLDYQNLKRRADTERESIADKRMEETARGLVEVLDVFQLGRASVASMKMNGPQMEQVLKGIEMMEGGILALFQRVGVAPIETKGRPFDPNFHESIGFVEKDDLDDGTIVSEVRKGFIYKGRTVRPAHVIVNKKCEHKGKRKKN